MNKDSLKLYTEAVIDTQQSTETEGSNLCIPVLIGLIVLASIAFYFYRDSIKRFVWNYYIKIASKMGKIQAIKVVLRNMMENHDYEAVMIKAEEILGTPSLLKEDIEEVNSILLSAKYRIYDSSLSDITSMIENDVENAELRLINLKDQILTLESPKKPELELRCKNITRLIWEGKYKKSETTLLQYIDSNNIEKAATTFVSIHETYSNLNLSNVDQAFNQYIRKLLNEYNSLNKYDEIAKLVNILTNYPRIRKSSLFQEILTSLYESIRIAIKNNSINELDQYKRFFSIEACNRLESELNAHQLMIDKQLKEIYQKAIDFANAKDYENALIQIEKGEKLGGRSLVKERAEIEEIKQQHLQNEQRVVYEGLIESVKDAINRGDEDEALMFISDAEKISIADESEIRSFKVAVKNIEKLKSVEKTYFGKFPIGLVPSFNVPKKPGKGEDSDPICDVSGDRCWGILGVFDGMGGAGGRHYKHKDTQEEHTSAYWASRIVQKTVIDMMNHRLIGTNPIEYFETNIRKFITNALDREIENFPVANIKAPSKLIRKFPTTLAISLYFIQDNTLNIYNYWAGDSRIYLFNGETQYFLTLDDSDAPNNDPFAPENSDLAMNNAICQDKDKPFRINKSTVSFRLDKDNPIILMAATDGCFGYYTNPIEFEEMIREKLKSSNSLCEWSDNIKNAIIENIQQDDFSMSMVVLGYSHESLNVLQNALTKRLKDPIFANYHRWLDNYKNELGNFNLKLEKITEDYRSDNISEAEKETLNEEYEKVEEEMLKYKLDSETTNSSLYLSYKKSIIIVEPSNVI